MTTKIYITATSVDPDTMEENHGWIDPEWSMTQLHDDKEDVRYIDVDSDTYPDVQDQIYQIIGDTHTDDGERFYGDGSTQDMNTGIDWSYCAHVES